MSDPWAFGWNQALTSLGLLITITIAIAGFRSFGKWKREKIEEKRIDIAIDALALAYESKFVFDNIRSALSFPYEWDEMPVRPGESEENRSQRGPFFAVLKRIQAHKEFFERAWKLQVKCSAIFGPQAEDIFLLMQKARRQIEVSAGMLLRDPTPTHKTQDNIDTWDCWRGDVWEPYEQQSKSREKVTPKLNKFRKGIEGMCRPIIDREFKPEKPLDGALPGRLQYLIDWRKKRV